MSSNTFNSGRFALLFRQHLIHHADFLLLSAVAYMGVIFIVLSIAQLANNGEPHNIENFQGFLIGFVGVFGVLYAGHAFPAFRNKESTINYLMVPASLQEKFLFEFITRIGMTLLLLPILYWLTFHIQGYFMTMLIEKEFPPIGAQYLVNIDVPDPENQLLFQTLVASALLLAYVLAFTGAAMFDMQPLVKSLFALALVVIFFLGYSYIVIEHLGFGEYNPPVGMILLPVPDELKILRMVTIGIVLTTAVMLYVAFLKLKEREV